MNYKILFFLLFSPLFIQAQLSSAQQQQLEALNNYIHFTNESTHGLLIAHRLLETFNQKINKYVDLESNQLNFYSNADLPRNIFEDEEQWFYEVSPYKWYEKALADSKALPSATLLNAQLNNMKTIITRVNALRFELEYLTKQDDLKERKNLDKIYDKLEECVRLYEDFYAAKKSIKNDLQKTYRTLSIAFSNKEVGNLVAIHENIRAFLEGVLKEDRSNLPALSQHLRNNLETAKSFKITDRDYQQVLSKAYIFDEVAQKYLNNVPFPPEYAQYGSTYYYYNVEMVSKFNRYGSGLVENLNNWIKSNQFPILYQLEEPHFFKVIYPKREVKTEKIEKIDATLPKKIRDRDVIIRQQSLNLEAGKIILEVYDHQLLDGDIVSLNFNGFWILNKYTLRRKPKKIQLELKPNSENYIILHAENMGKNPPNTVAITYIHKGEKQKIVLESTMNESEMIRLNVE